MVLLRLLGAGLAIYFFIIFAFFVSELEENQKKEQEEQEKEQEKLIRNAYLRGNEFIRQYIKDLKNPPNSNILSGLPPVLAGTLFETIGRKFSGYDEIVQMQFSPVSSQKGFYHFSFRIIDGNLEQNASLLEDLTAETVKDCFVNNGFFPADAVVTLQKSTKNVATVFVNCADDEATYTKLQAFKQQQANIVNKKRVDLIGNAVDGELENDLNSL